MSIMFAGYTDRTSFTFSSVSALYGEIIVPKAAILFYPQVEDTYWVLINRHGNLEKATGRGVPLTRRGVGGRYLLLFFKITANMANIYKD